MDQFAAHLDRGWDLVSRGDLAGALLSAEQGLELNEESPEAHNLMGYVLAAEGRCDEALGHYQRAIDIDEGYVEAMLNAAEMMIHPLHNFDGALEMIEEALDFAEDEDEIADATLLKVEALLHMGNTDAARPVLDTLTGPFDNAHLEFLIARAKFEVGDVEGAASCLSEALEREPNDPEMHYYWGLICEARSESSQATLSFLRSRELELQRFASATGIDPEAFHQRVRSAVSKVRPPLCHKLNGALVVVTDLPGAEVVAEGVDPRVEVLCDGPPDASGAPTSIGRIFVYKRNIERLARDILEVEDTVIRALEHELAELFPDLNPSSDQADESAPRSLGATKPSGS